MLGVTPARASVHLRSAARSAQVFMGANSLSSMSISSEDWKSGIGFELDFWDRWAEDSANTDARNDPNRAYLFESILKADAEKGQTQFRVLDVGAGPLSMMGYALPSMPGARLELVPTDPLGDTYAKALLKAGVIPLVAVRTIMAEDLSKVFSECSQENDNWARCFDLSTSRNALDHAKDPVECIRQMVLVTKPGHTIKIIGNTNEAENAMYAGFHQWNFANVEGRFTVWSRRTSGEVDVATALGALASKVVCSKDSEKFGKTRTGTMECTITRARMRR